MIKLRSMPERKKYQHAFDMVCRYQRHVLPFVEVRLGYDPMYELKSVWQAGIAPIHDDDSDQTKYENAYSNWLWMARCSHDFLADKLDRQGVADYKRLILQLHKQLHDNPDLAIYDMVNNHVALAKAWAYEMQWLTSIEMTTKFANLVTCAVRDCKVWRTPGTERICRVDCRNVGTELARQVYHLKRVTTVVDHSCRIVLTPLED